MTLIVAWVDLPLPASEIWAELSHLERHSEWMADAERIDFADEQRRGVGTEMVVRTRVGPFVTNDVITVRSWIEGESIGVSHRGLVTGIGVFVLVPIEDGTRFVWLEDLTFPWYLGGAVTAIFAAPVLRWIWQRNLKRFAATLVG
ncbi:MAG: SRPBCC family protein [Acidimicrobiia bacterium]